MPVRGQLELMQQDRVPLEPLELLQPVPRRNGPGRPQKQVQQNLEP